MTNDIQETRPQGQAAARPFRRAVLRGLAVLCPPLLTVLFIVWAINTTKSYFLEPVTGWAREGIVWCIADVRQDLPLPNRRTRRPPRWTARATGDSKTARSSPNRSTTSCSGSPANRRPSPAKTTTAATSI